MPDTLLRAVPFALTLTVPADSAPLDVAQEVADAVRDLQRATTGERYPASAEFAIPREQPDEFELVISGAQLPTGHRLLFLAGLIWARRIWDEAGAESDAVMIDTRHAVARLCAQRWPQTDPPAGLPVDLHTVQLAAVPGQLARTAFPDDEVAPLLSLSRL